METKNILDIKTRKEFREWLALNHEKETECWVAVKKGKVKPVNAVWYLDSVEEALCFGWIDTTHKTLNGVDLQKFTPRDKKSAWSELNIEHSENNKMFGEWNDNGLLLDY